MPTLCPIMNIIRYVKDTVKSRQNVQFHVQDRKLHTRLSLPRIILSLYNLYVSCMLIKFETRSIFNFLSILVL